MVERQRIGLIGGAKRLPADIHSATFVGSTTVRIPHNRMDCAREVSRAVSNSGILTASATKRVVMISKIADSAEAAVRDIPNGATLMIGGFGTAGQPVELIDALLEQGARDLTIVNNNAGNGTTGLAALLGAGRVRKIVCSFPRQVDSQIFDDLYRAGAIELELVPQGTLAERIRAGGAGIAGFFTPTAFGTTLAKGKETRRINNRDYVLEDALTADYALIKAHMGDRLGNLIYRKTARNFGPLMASAATTAIAQVSKIVHVGELDPEAVVTPGIFVERLVEVGGKLPTATKGQ